MSRNFKQAARESVRSAARGSKFPCKALGRASRGDRAVLPGEARMPKQATRRVPILHPIFYPASRQACRAIHRGARCWGQVRRSRRSSRRSLRRRPLRVAPAGQSLRPKRTFRPQRQSRPAGQQISHLLRKVDPAPSRQMQILRLLLLQNQQVKRMLPRCRARLRHLRRKMAIIRRPLPNRPIQSPKRRT
jgi:hypothetical protein